MTAENAAMEDNGVSAPVAWSGGEYACTSYARDIPLNSDLSIG
jgi:hypothetical protein